MTDWGDWSDTVCQALDTCLQKGTLSSFRLIQLVIRFLFVASYGMRAHGCRTLLLQRRHLQTCEVLFLCDCCPVIVKNGGDASDCKVVGGTDTGSLCRDMVLTVCVRLWQSVRGFHWSGQGPAQALARLDTCRQTAYNGREHGQGAVEHLSLDQHSDYRLMYCTHVAQIRSSVHVSIDKIQHCLCGETEIEEAMQNQSDVNVHNQACCFSSAARTVRAANSSTAHRHVAQFATPSPSLLVIMNWTIRVYCGVSTVYTFNFTTATRPSCTVDFSPVAHQQRHTPCNCSEYWYNRVNYVSLVCAKMTDITSIACPKHSQHQNTQKRLKERSVKP